MHGTIFTLILKVNILRLYSQHFKKTSKNASCKSHRRWIVIVHKFLNRSIEAGLNISNKDVYSARNRGKPVIAE